MNPSLEVMYFHAGQSYAMAGNEYYVDAISCLEKSYMRSEKWNRYVKGTIAYLSGDKQALHELLQSETMNTEILEAFAASLDHGHGSYRQDYKPPQ